MRLEDKIFLLKKDTARLLMLLFLWETKVAFVLHNYCGWLMDLFAVP